jgi:hypothetical protein
LPDLHLIGRLKVAVGYLSPLIVTVVVIVRQLYLGETSDALHLVVTVFTEQMVSVPWQRVLHRRAERLSRMSC